MNSVGNAVLEQALALSPLERAELVGRLVESLDSSPDSEVDALWAVEVERRLEAYRRGDLESVPMEEVFREIDERR